jgi:predicted nucleotidyltransferase
MARDPLLTTLLDLDAALESRELIVGGGYGLFLKQLHVRDHPDVRTLFSHEILPTPRTTEDIDLILRAEIVTDSESMKEIRDALDTLGFEVVDTAKYMQFTREMEPGQVKIDLLAAPLGEFAGRVKKDVRRVRPKPSVKLHASKLEEAVGVERDTLRIPISGTLSSGESHETEVLIPQAFTYALTKLCAFRDRMDDDDKDLGRHHALDLYRIVGLLAQDEDAAVRKLSEEFASHPVVIDAGEVAATHFVDADGVGRLRIREHSLYQESFDLDRFAEELQRLLAAP